ncbi:MAG TPA: discoidin domain-containing protein [Paludibaculum sp.]|jgi:hypothetical protein
MKRILLSALITAATMAAQPYTRGIGVYPGDPKDDVSPVMRIDSTTYRNLALRRPAWHSSSYDYNLTAQLVTDGIKDTRVPRWVVTSTSEHGILKKHEREWLFDNNWISTVDLKGGQGWIQMELGGGDGALEADSLAIDARPRMTAQGAAGWTCIVSGSEDGQSWEEIARAVSTERPKREFQASIPFGGVKRSRFYRVSFDAASVTLWQVGELTLQRNAKRLEAAGPFDFTSAWRSAGAGDEWVAVDLGAECTIDRVALSWIRRAAEGTLEISSDNKTWRSVGPLADEMRLAPPARARYVRVHGTRPEWAQGYLLSELEVFGRGGPVAEPRPKTQAWRVQRSSEVKAGGDVLSRPGFNDRDWVAATVPGTTLTSYYNAGALPDPNFGDNQLMISDSYFYSDFWYRHEFTAPAAAAGRHIWLNFDGINWKAEVYLNGEKLGRIEGGFLRAKFDVTARLKPGPNALAVLVQKNATPGNVKEKTFQEPDKNGGALGADNPTYHASIGWDWIPTIRGRNTGIWNDVRFTETGAVSIENPRVTTALPLPDTSRAEIGIEVTLRNHETTAVSGNVRGRFGDLPFEQAVTVEASATRTVKVDLRMLKPKLWWPAGYGEAHLYAVELHFEAGAKAVSDSTTVQAGVRQFAFSEEGAALRMWINGRRFIPRGGNWGFGESMLRYRGREYDAAVRYHRDMNFTMIRNWVGMIGEDEFYEACDRHGIVVWQDFWLANPVDGPDPDDNAMFLANARDTVLRIRNHPSVGLYCGRNEGYPPKPLDDGIRALLAELHPGLHYISSSADDVVSGHGPYRAQPLKLYFEQRATPKFHSEMGMPNIVTMDSLRAMMPESDMWPQGAQWGLHDFCLNGAQGGASFIDSINKSYGGAKTVEEWVTLAQFVNYEGYRAMFEAQSKNRMGLLIWMSHPTWPSFVWQTYDYYLEPTAAYFGARKASEPLHIQWNPVTESVEVVNYNGGDASGLTASVEVIDMSGVRRWTKAAALNSEEDSVQSPIRMEYPADLTPVQFLRLKLTRGAAVISENFYWRGTEQYNYRALRDLPSVALQAVTKAERKGATWTLTTELTNPAKTPALMVRLKAVRAQTGDRILPVLYGDNYIALMPGEKRTIQTEVQEADTRGEQPRIMVEGFNVAGR